MKTFLLNSMAALLTLSAGAQCAYDDQKLRTDSLDRGVVAVRDGNIS